ncbi:hypothetical protein BHE74_00008464 [Ensete ventricosum]|uniref:Uncharacterized protein n=1 Tax=Ensete ventricosum TaxID=4639 RepID=A0A444DNM4_ENSVE|nr:hypothetical protein B296_00029728 [Ensete ventricosum]RWV99754.1 hypothetical protein GW17_00037322 [Ensete ventricosum]RWW83046.1 hypothetical protein BHE74_00008464 [Ensete ventricosum]
MPYVIGTWNTCSPPPSPTHHLRHLTRRRILWTGNETFEKLGTLGTSANLLVYLTTVFHMKSVAAATLVTVFNGTTSLTPLLGAFLADTYLGRYATLGAASVASFLVCYHFEVLPFSLTSFSRLLRVCSMKSQPNKTPRE